MGRIITIGGKAMSSDNMEPLVNKEGNKIIPTEPSEWLDGVQIWEKGICVGTIEMPFSHICTPSSHSDGSVGIIVLPSLSTNGSILSELIALPPIVIILPMKHHRRK